MDPRPQPDDGVTVPRPQEGTPPTTQRLAGLLLAGLGGLLMCVGALMPWVRTTLEGAPDEVSPTYFGIDITDGKVVLALGIFVLGALIGSRMVRSPSLARTMALIIIVSAFAGVGVTTITLITADSRFHDPAVEAVLTQVEAPTDEMRAQVDELIELELAAGPFAAIGGGILALAGGALTLAWANARAHEPT